MSFAQQRKEQLWQEHSKAEGVLVEGMDRLQSPQRAGWSQEVVPIFTPMGSSSTGNGQRLGQ